VARPLSRFVSRSRLEISASQGGPGCAQAEKLSACGWAGWRSPRRDPAPPRHALACSDRLCRRGGRLRQARDPREAIAGCKSLGARHRRRARRRRRQLGARRRDAPARRDRPPPQSARHGRPRSCKLRLGCVCSTSHPCRWACRGIAEQQRWQGRCRRHPQLRVLATCFRTLRPLAGGRHSTRSAGPVALRAQRARGFKRRAGIGYGSSKTHRHSAMLVWSGQQAATDWHVAETRFRRPFW